MNIPQNNLREDHASFINKLCPYRKKLYWRSIKRGMKEMDLLLGGFARQYLADMDENEVKDFADILHCYDQDILGWLTNPETPAPKELQSPILDRLKIFKPHIDL